MTKAGSNSETIRQQKQALREEIRRRKLAHTASESSGIIAHSGEETSGVLSRLLADCHVQQAQTVLLYSALRDEVPTQALLDELSAEGKTVLLPRVVSDTEMELRRYTGPADLAVGAFGIQEPTGAVFSDYKAIDVAIIPGLAFDGEGRRLGRGRGYYDRLLARVPFIYKIGLCFPWQMVERVPSNGYDIMMDSVVF